MPRTILLLVPALAFGSAFQGCNGEALVDPIAERQIPEELRADVASVARSNNAFALDLYGEIRGESANIFFSPFSMTTALSMTMAGAAGRTEEEMASVLRHTLQRDALHRACGALVASLDRGSGRAGYRLQTANGLWTQQGYPFLEGFLSVPRDLYGAEAGHFDFAGNPEAARRRINEWVEGKTEGKIQDLFPSGTINPLTRLVLANAVYFKGNWHLQFDPDLTKTGVFHVGRDRDVQTPLMHRSGSFPFAEADGVKILEMPYMGKDLSMIALLPEDRDGLGRLEERLSLENIQGWMSLLSETTLEVTFPKFRTTSSIALNRVLADMGMPSAFDADLADFSPMIGRRELFIHAVVHKAFIDVNEEGTEAAAATGVSVGPTSLPPSFRADHPFIYLIWDNVTESILFMGRLVDPTA
jgi:serpin B